MLEVIFYGVLKFIYYAFPVALVAGAIALGCSLGLGVKDDRVASWAGEQRNLDRHIVTIDWGYSERSNTEIDVMENQPWTISGYSWGNALFTEDTEYAYESYIRLYHGISTSKPSVPTRTGYVFTGLFSSEVGGIQYVNGAGYGMREVIEDMTLYALWEVV